MRQEANLLAHKWGGSTGTPSRVKATASGSGAMGGAFVWGIDLLTTASWQCRWKGGGMPPVPAKLAKKINQEVCGDGRTLPRVLGRAEGGQRGQEGGEEGL